MVNGPPTPPATTPAELHDEARASIPLDYSSAPISVPTTSHPSPEVYQNAIPLMSEAIARDDYSRLVHIAERTDTSCTNERHQSRLLIIAPLVLGHLILDDLTPARYALLRLPDNLASLPLSRALSALVTATVNRQHSAVYDHANTLNTVVSHPDFTDKELAGVISQLLSVFIDTFRQRTFALLSKAYTSLPLSLACIYLALPAEQVIDAAQKHSWSYDFSGQILNPVKGPDISLQSFSSLTTFGLVSDSVAKLEG
ncbi:hypothetical protein CVT25_015226 [Psilocybe cyanescens]|uniref:CSN8/PSMD8/EIF3K domain-containing protein n=1 Tax=Psilocybe cyanescens TaxID=93625 RepID=A0A409XR78_PSICY|nr:hypothetical protein CVT25_015226 [Psilocybe cyanescens]